ncbi:molybdopterin-dependent oxidoreductase [bacterium]|nr:molybdopterin-dependent oxidoreductase [bacterium]
MTDLPLNRRDILRSSAGTFAAGLALLVRPDFVFPAESDDEELVPFLNVPRTGPNRLDWETLDMWLTPQDQVFSVQHYNVPEINADDFQLEITGMVNRSQTLTMDDIRKLPKKDQLMTLECSGNGASPGFMNAIYNSRWTGTLLAPLLKECGIHDDAIEVVFIGHDRKEETLRPGTKRELKFEVPFGRSMSIDDALNLPLLLAYERNGEPLEVRNGAPLRLIVPGWYGIANVKWLHRIEIRNRRYMGRYMARDYVTVRAEKRGDEVEYIETSVGRMNLKSIIARVTRGETTDGKVPLKAYGAVWNNGTPIRSVEVKLNDGEWREAKLDAEPVEQYCWRFFSIDLGNVEPGKHTLVSRGIDTTGRVQPSADDDEIALKRTYWEAYQQWPREIEVTA